MSFKKLEKEINYSFKDSDLLKQSLTHKSFDDITNNENLEFLGDRVLGLIIAKKLIEIFPNEKEGIIDKKFANLVSKKTCSEIGRKMSLKKFMFLGNSYKKIKASDDKILGDCLEALIGAIYLDSNIEKTGNFILSFWSEHLKKSDFTFIDAKTRLQEYSLKKFKELPKYETKNQKGSHHDPIFKIEVKIRNSKSFSGEGNSKKKAQQNAAMKLLRFLNI
tara:strand:- start:549 stop:1208 length:660 start_codon:yes stop_codon:yes gene_type:complete